MSRVIMAFYNDGKEKNIIRLGGGLPTFSTPGHILDAMKKEIDRLYDNRSIYGPPTGTLEFREAIADYQKQWDVEVDPENVIVTAGAQQGAFVSLYDLVKSGGEVILTNPGFSSHYGYLNHLGVTPKVVPRYEENDWKLNPSDIAKVVTPNTKGIILCNPDNPTCDFIEKDVLDEISRIALENNLVIIQEQMYNRMVWDDNRFYSFAENPEMHDNTIIVDSVSKTYGMPGWRLGYIIIPSRFKEKINTHLWQIAAGTNLHIQEAGIAALTGPQDEINDHMKLYEDRMNYAYVFWSSLDGVTVNKPKGAYYIFPNISSFGLPSDELYSYLKEEAKVELFPGSKFGANGEGHIRQCTAFPLELQEEAFSRIEKALNNLRK